MNQAQEDEFVIGQCRWCESKTEVFRDNGLCEECDRNLVKCGICDEEQHYEDTCRHVFQDSEFTWMGSGVGLPGPYDLSRLKRSLFRLFDLMPGGFAPDLRMAIAARKFHTWMIAPMIGGGGLLELHGMPDREGIRYLFGWGDALIEIGEGNHAEETSDGYHWLVSLYDDKTPDANAATVAWIDEWLTRKVRR